MSKSLKKIPTLEFNIYFQLYIESVAMTFKQDAYAFANMKSRKQIQFSGKGFKPEKSDHGGDLPHVLNRKRPLGVRSTMHLVLRSSKAKNHWSFEKFDREIQQLLIKFA